MTPPTYILGISAFYHGSAACLLRDGLAFVAFYHKPLLKFERILETYLGIAPRGFGSFLKAGPLWIKEKIYRDCTLRDALGK